MVTVEQHPEYFRWASERLKVDFKPDQGCKVVTNLSADGRILGVVVYSRFHTMNCEMSVASDGSGHWANRLFVKQAFFYPFVQLNKRRVMAVVEEDNDRALRLNRHLGFVEEGRLRKWFGEKDGILLGMLREECRWLK